MIKKEHKFQSVSDLISDPIYLEPRNCMPYWEGDTNRALTAGTGDWVMDYVIRRPQHPPPPDLHGGVEARP